MTKIPPIIGEAESFVRQLATEFTRVRDGECLCCYMARQLDEYPCDGTHRHALRYRDAVAPRVTTLKRRLSQLGACCCDCELFMNGYEPHRRFWTPGREIRHNGIVILIDAEPPEDLAPCAGVKRGSTAPCDNWVRVRRG